ncbi:MAG TPA: bifunctional precorrin-2 dehydrogenase/sirohydrochlorin ferrochelatase [Candidatus Binatia bacterium]|nr:bifunctional precorrin-2 dehydrogenase/sirohydrochlorin ferrochelatase [Candidatus Binatia bacterium]
MRTHPVLLRLDGRRCVVVGGDETAARKAAACLAAGGDVTVVAPALPPPLTAPPAHHVAREYRSGDLAGAFLAYAVTRDAEVIRRLADEAVHERVLLNVVDVPEACTFLAPAVLERGDLRVAVGTGGASPGLAARLRRELEERIGPEYATFVAILGAVRRALADEPTRAATLEALLDSRLLDVLRLGTAAEVDAVLTRVAGPRCTLARLGVGLPEV